MTLEQIRRDPERVKHLRNVLADAGVKELIHAILLSPPTTVVDAEITDTFSKISFGANLGHLRFHHLLLSGGTHFELPPPANTAAMSLEPEEDEEI